jgi:pteridine reductase
MEQARVALITGGAKRIGAVLVKTLHRQGFNIALHYRHSHKDAQAIADELNQQRPNSVLLLAAAARDVTAFENFLTQIEKTFGRLDVLINNASSFFPTPIGEATLNDWDALIDSNLKMAFFLSQACTKLLSKTKGCIVNITDVHTDIPFRNYSIYRVGKAGLKALTENLALELAPEIRVNAVAPGWVLPNPELDDLTGTQNLEARLAKIPLQRIGTPDAIAQAVSFLIDADYVTGITLAVDGGRHLS